MVIAQRDIWWSDLGEPIGSAPGYRRPVLVVQCDLFNSSNVQTVVCVPLTANVKWAKSAGNVLLSAEETGLPRDSVANVSQILTLDRTELSEWAGHLDREAFGRVLAGIDVLLGRDPSAPHRATR